MSTFKKNTAVTGFPFALVDSSDGSAITTGTVTVYITKDGGTQATSTNSATHEGNGQWSINLTASEMNGDVVGILATHTSAVLQHFTIKTDTKITSELNDLDAAAVNAQCDIALADYDAPTKAELDSAVAPLATASNLATVDSNVDAILVDTNELQTNQGDWVTATGFATSAALATVDANVDAILVDTGTTIPAQITALNDLSAADVNAEVDTALADIHLDHLFATNYDPASKPGTSTALLNEMVENDGGVSRFTANALEQAPSGGGGTADWTSDEREEIRERLGITGTTATPGGTPSLSTFDASTDTVDVGAINGSTEAAQDLSASAGTIVRGTAATGTLSTTQMTTDLSESTDDHYNGRVIIWTSGVLKDQATNITDYSGTNGLLTFTAVTEAPSNSDTFVIV